ncbi:hypothetical protein DL96DRAFT_1687790 [Flagelloscypha sp. PMI_526]|nr:hypothetical protein DL96DRAFT_1687790 [Flagelloscypha sp. PMI_526]
MHTSDLGEYQDALELREQVEDVRDRELGLENLERIGSIATLEKFQQIAVGDSRRAQTKTQEDITSGSKVGFIIGCGSVILLPGVMDEKDSTSLPPLDTALAATVTSAEPLDLVLCISSAYVSSYPAPPNLINAAATDDEARAAPIATTPSTTLTRPPSRLPVFANQGDPTHIRLLSRPLSNFQAIAMDEHSGWLQSVASDICVSPSDPLEPKIYEYQPSALVRLCKISKRKYQSEAETGRTSSASSMARDIEARDDSCWFCGHYQRVSSHIIPKRMGDAHARALVDEWCGMESCQWSLYTAQLGILLCPNHAYPFAPYDEGLRHDPHQDSDWYTIHQFDPKRQTWQRSTYHQSPPVIVTEHGSRITTPNPTDPKSPPPGVLKWHYLQCVLKWFAHDDYLNLSHITWSQLPLRYDLYRSEDYDSDCEGSISHLQPSAVLDFGRFEEWCQEEEAARLESVARWVSTQIPYDTELEE